MGSVLRMNLLAGLAALLLASSGATAQVVPDGGTATGVATDAAGKSTVAIAPPGASGISHNTYSDFSVGAAGVDLDNRTAVARSILNEVTSSRASIIAGPVEVLGARAHVVVANPNGITVNGGSFHNTGGVVLTSGKPSIVTRTVAPGLTQDNIVLETASGRIDVTGAGLSGAMTSLQLIAGQIGIDGPVENTSPNIRSDIRLIAGGSRVEYDSSILPISDLEDWGRVTDEGGVAGGLAVEISARGTLKANRVRILATNEGAGVSHAGQGLASMADFTISAKGKVTTSGSIKAARHVKIAARSIEARSVPGEPQSTIEAVSGALTLIASAGDITNTGVLMSGAVRDPNDPDSRGGATLRATGDIRLLTENADQLAIVFAAADDLNVTATGDIVNNTGRLLSNATTRLTAGGDVINTIDIVPGDTPIGAVVVEHSRGKRLWYTFWQSRRRSEHVSVDYGDPRIEGDQQAFIVGEDVEIVAGGDVVNRGSSINANSDDVTIDAAGITNEAVIAGSLSYTKSCGLFCVGYGTSNVRLVGGTINAAVDIELTAATQISNSGQLTGFGDMRLTAPEVALQGQRVATVFSRPPGLYNFWNGSFAWIGYRDEGGLLIAPGGSITIDAFRPITVDAGVIEARDGVFVPRGIDIVTPPEEVSPLGNQPIGLFHELVGE